MRSLRLHVAISLVFILLSFTEAGVIKDFFTGLAVGKKETEHKQPTEYGENEPRTPGHSNDDHRSSGSKPSGQYGAAGTYTKKPVVIDGTTEKYKNTSWYIENEDYLSPNKNEQKQQKPNNQYGAAGTYTIKPAGETGTHVTQNWNKQQRPTEYTNKYNNQRPIEENVRVREATRSSTPIVAEKSEEKNASKVVLQADGVTCCYSNLEDNIENRKLHCNEIDCHLDKVYEKSSLWVCDTMKCTIASVDFSQEQGSKKLMECSDGRNIITVNDKPLNCGPNEREHNGKCRKIFGATKPGCDCSYRVSKDELL